MHTMQSRNKIGIFKPYDLKAFGQLVFIFIVLKEGCHVSDSPKQEQNK